MSNENILDKDIAEVIISEEELKNRIKEMGEEITHSYSPDDDIIMIGVLRGAILFMADLARNIKLPVTFDFMDVSSYGDSTTSSGVVRIIKDLEENIENKHVLIAEDIMDTGLTLKHIVEMLKTRNPASIKIATLLDKPDRRVQKKITADYGLDYAERYRNLPYIGVLKEEMYT